MAATKNDAEAAGVRDPLQKIGVTGVINTVIGKWIFKSARVQAIIREEVMTF